MTDGTPSVTVWLPTHLRTLAGVGGTTVEVRLERGTAAATVGDVLDALEREFPALRGTIRDHPADDGSPGDLRPFMRLFALDSDLTREGPDGPLPPEVATGDEVLRIVGAIAGG